MTLTGLVKLLTEQFLPDIHQHYLFENYRQQQFCRVTSDTVPDYLRGRPQAVIKHCLVRKTNSNKFTAEAIQTTEKPGVSCGESQRREAHSGFWYCFRGGYSILFMQGLDKVAHSLQTFLCCLSSET